MDTSKLYIPPRSRKRSLLGSSTSTLGTVANTSGSTRLNTHVLLGLSVLILSANAQPLDATSPLGVGPASAGSMSSLGLLGLAGKGLSKVGETALGERIVESIGKALGSTSREGAIDRVLGEDPTSLAGLLSSGENAPVEADIPTSDNQAIPNPTNFLEDLVAHNPALSFALNIADLMHKMRELFVDIAVLEGEERGLRFANRPSQTQDVLSQESPELLLLEEQRGALGLEVAPNADSEQVDVTADTEELQFDLDASPDVSVTIPGSFDVDPAEEKQAHATVPPGLNPLVNPYAALAMSSVLATLFVVSLMVGRHYFLTQAAKTAEPDLEQGSPSDSEDNGAVEKSASQSVHEELDEKALIELDAPTDSILIPNAESARSDAKEATEALELLIDVANAALSASILPVDSSKAPPKLETPKMVVAALETMRAEMNKTPLNLDVEKGSLSRRLLLARSRPATPLRVPSRPQTPSLTFTSAEDGHNHRSFTLPKPIPRPSFLHDPTFFDSPASSYVSTASHLGDTLEGHAASVHLNSPTPSMVHLSSGLSTSPAPSYVTAHPSPAMSYATAQASPVPSDVVLPPAAPIRQRIDSPVLSTGTLDSPRPTESALALFDDISRTDDMHLQSRSYTGGVIPPAHLTETALNLALMLPATEWIFQFLVVFIGWFGFWMRPVHPTHRCRY